VSVVVDFPVSASADADWSLEEKAGKHISGSIDRDNNNILRIF
jgi:hypothetical protein